MQPFTKIPFLRVMVPVVTGAIAQTCYGLGKPDIALIAFFLLAGAVLVFKRPINLKFKTSGLLALDVALFLIVLRLAWHTSIINTPEYYGNFANTDSVCTYVVVVSEIPEQRPKTVKCELQVKAVCTGTVNVPVKGKLLVYLKNSAKAHAVKAGDALLLRAVLKPVMPPLNPGQFDYRTYLFNRHIYHTAYADTLQFEKIAGDYLNPLQTLGLKLKHQLIANIASAKLSNEAAGICNALLTGYDGDVDKSVIDAFSHSGTLHVLSVSGLHTGLIYLVLNLLLGLADRRNRFVPLRFAVISVVLWLFALITGFSAPVLRSVIMFNLFGFGKLFFRSDYRNQVNILLASAFVLLLAEPYYITDVGFLLSYAALAGILCLEPFFNQLWQPGNWLFKQVWKSVSASVAATIGTLPIALFFFKQFPFWFVVTNLVVVPLSFALLLLALALAIKFVCFAPLINHITTFLLWFMNVFAAVWPGYVDTIDFGFPDVVFCTLLILMLGVFVLKPGFVALRLSLLVLVCWQFTALVGSYQAKSNSAITVYSLRRASAISVKNNTQVLLRYTDTLQYSNAIKPHLVSFNNPAVEKRTFNLVRFGGKTLLVLDKPGYFPQAELSEVGFLVTANNFVPNEELLGSMYNLQLLIADCSNNRAAVRKTEEICRKFGLEFYDVAQSGYFQITIE